MPPASYPSLPRYAARVCLEEVPKGSGPEIVLELYFDSDTASLAHPPAPLRARWIVLLVRVQHVPLLSHIFSTTAASGDVGGCGEPGGEGVVNSSTNRGPHSEARPATPLARLPSALRKRLYCSGMLTPYIPRVQNAQHPLEYAEVCQNEEYVRLLEQQTYAYMHQLETMFGRRDGRFLFRSITRSTDPPDVPYIDFPYGFHFNGDCVVNICVSEWPWEHCSPDQGPWQVAHECVHLLDPGPRGGSNFLEEGLATWFQDEPAYHGDAVQRYIARNPPHPHHYAEAKELVLLCMPQLQEAVRTIRSSGIRIGDITTDGLAEHLEGVDRATVERLCTRFEY